MTQADDFGDPKMNELLASWGRRMGTSSALFEPPEPTVLRIRLAEIDRRLPVDQGPDAHRIIRVTRFRGGLALAAVFALLFGGWWVARQFTSDKRLVVSDVTALRTAHILRDEHRPTSFRSGDSVFLHFEAQQAGQAAVGMLDSRSRFALIPGAESLSINPNHNSLGPFTLDDNTGTESFVTIIGSEFDPLRCEQLVLEALAEEDRASSSHSDLLQQVTNVLHTVPDITVRTVTINHLPAE